MGSLWSKTTVAGLQPSDIFFPDDPIEIPVRTAFGKGGIEQKSLKKMVEDRCPSLWKPFKPVWWLCNGHLQTLYCVLGDFTRVDKVVYERTYLRLMDGGTLGLDFTPIDQSNIPDTTPVLVVLTGLTGGSYEAYIRSILSTACRPVSEGGLGYRAAVINFRGCAGVPMTSKQLYSAGYTDDLRVALMYIVKQYPNAPLLGMGFSLGANVLVRYLAEEGERSRLLSGCALGCPWDLTRNNDALENTFIGRNIYSKGMASNLLRVLGRHASRLRSPPPPSPSSSVPQTPVKPNPTQDAVVLNALTNAFALRSPTLEQFDNAFTSKAGGAPPILPFPSSKEYYAWASSHYVLPKVRKPLLVINANDDPVVKHVPTGQEEVGNNCTVVVVTGGGGHLGWFEVGEGKENDGSFMTPTLASDSAGLTRWIKQPVVEWLRMVAEDFDFSQTQNLDQVKPRPVYEDSDGWLREAGLDEERIQKDGDVWGPLGCRVIPTHEVEESDIEQDKTVIDGAKTKTGNGVLQGL
ncbi:hypothetical protein VKT23_011736 [Stygiomarasmius scandens]|uniref:AB hydrolase-1 domain-containing protein n=1 Tax=Marasmiellus scandens TaxID=2682957 RepID=A0ABR1J8V2_9AGAR